MDRFSIAALAVALAVSWALYFGALDSNVLGGNGYDGGGKSFGPKTQTCTIELYGYRTENNEPIDMLSPQGKPYYYNCPVPTPSPSPRPTGILEFNPTPEWCDSNDPNGVMYACECDGGRKGDPTCKNLPGSGALCGPQSGACLAPEPEPTYGTYDPSQCFDADGNYDCLDCIDPDTGDFKC